MMTKAAVQIGVAPNFQSDIPVSERLTPSSLLSISENTRWGDDVCLFSLPEYLRRRWWSFVAAEMLDEADERPNFHAFIESFKDFAFFKRIPLSFGLEFDVLLRAPNEINGVSSDANIVGIVNLGDERSDIVIGHELVTLDVGDGCWAPKNASITLTDTLSKKDIDALLIIKNSRLNNQLQKDLGIYSFISNDSLNRRVSISNGVCLAEQVEKSTEYVESAYVPNLPWREASQDELNRLFITKLTDTHTNTIGILRVPTEIMEQFSFLNLFESSSHDELMKRMNTKAGKTAINLATQFARSLTLDGNDLETKIIYNQPNLFTTTHLPGKHQYMGLHIDYTHQQSIFTRKQSANRISINLSNEDRYFLFVNLSVNTMIRLLKPTKSCTSDELAQAFFKAYPDYPVIRLKVAPGEAYIAPTQNIIHDGIGPKNAPDTHLTFCGYLDFQRALKFAETY